MRCSWVMVAAYETALMRMTQPVAAAPPPRAPIIRPARPGPRMRARLKAAELRPTALVTSSWSTSSDTNDWRAGASKAEPMPKTNASRYTCHTSTTPRTVIRPSTSEAPAITAWVTWSSRRLGKRSAITPAYGESSRTGRNWRPVVMPSAEPLPPVSCRTSQSWATRCIQVPVLLTTLPTAYLR